MPTPTFFRLPEARRERLVREALEEFAAHPYDQASISAIVERAGIAKGSVWQYFEDKLDLFRWLVEEGGRRRLAVLSEAPRPEGGGLYARLRGLYAAGLEAWRREPLWSRVLMRLVEPTREPRLEELRRARQAASVAFVRELLVEGQRAGEVRADVDPELYARLVLGVLQQGLLEAFLYRLGVELAELHRVADVVMAAPASQVLEVAEAAVALLEQGLRPAPRAADKA